MTTSDGFAICGAVVALYETTLRIAIIVIVVFVVVASSVVTVAAARTQLERRCLKRRQSWL